MAERGYFCQEMNGGWRDWMTVWRGPTHSCKPAEGEQICAAPHVQWLSPEEVSELESRK